MNNCNGYVPSGRCGRFRPAHNLPAEYFHGFTFSDRIANRCLGVSLCMSEVVAFNMERSGSPDHRRLS
jgi:hypothetical protein